MKTVYCPVLGRQVDGTTCLEIVLVTDHEAKPAILPEAVKIWDEKQRQKCLNCQYHAGIE